MDELTSRMPGLADHYESTDGCGGQFQGEPNYGPVARGATGASAVRRHSTIDEKNHGKNVSDPLGGQFQARLDESVSSDHEVFPGTRNCILYMDSTTLGLPRMIRRNRRRGPPTRRYTRTTRRGC